MSKASAVPEDLEAYANVALTRSDDFIWHVDGVGRAVTELSRVRASSPIYVRTQGIDASMRNLHQRCRKLDEDVLRVAKAFRMADTSHNVFHRVDERLLNHFFAKVGVVKPTTWREPAVVAVANPDEVQAFERFGVRTTTRELFARATPFLNCAPDGASVLYALDGKKRLEAYSFVPGPGGDYPLVNPGDPSSRSERNWQTTATTPVEVVMFGRPDFATQFARGMLAPSADVDSIFGPAADAAHYRDHFGITASGIPYAVSSDRPARFEVPNDPPPTNVVGAGANAVSVVVTGLDAAARTKNESIFATRVVYQQNSQGQKRAVMEAHQIRRGSNSKDGILSYVVGFTPSGQIIMDGKKYGKSPPKSDDSYIVPSRNR